MLVQQMTGREDRIYEEAASLWRELYDEPPPREADGATILDMITGGLAALQYARLNSPYLRPSEICFPKTGDS